MNRNNKKEVLSRRAFFKKSAAKILPIIGMTIVGPTYIVSCTEKNNCNGNCEITCEGSCDGSCTTSCTGSAIGQGCGNGCSNGCLSTCKETCTSSCGIGCSTGCASSCDTNCSSACNNSCGSECANACSSSCSNTCEEQCRNSANNGTSSEDVSDATGLIDGYEYVDLGLSVKWARYNFKNKASSNYHAESPFDGGTAQYLYRGLYSTSSDINTVLINNGYWRGDSIQGTDFDIITHYWGSRWRTPTVDEFQELLNNCSREFVTRHNRNGLLLTSRINGRSLFLPADGEIYNGEIGNVDYTGSYWTAIIYTLQSATELYYYFFSRTHDSLNNSDQYTERKSLRGVTNGSGGGSNNCNNNCTNSAYSNTCSNCQTGCSTTCSGQCRADCEGSCINGCSTLCGGQCHYSCGGTCSAYARGNACTGGTCATSCTTYCYHTCNLACSESCMSCCINSNS